MILKTFNPHKVAEAGKAEMLNKNHKFNTKTMKKYNSRNKTQ